MAEFETVLKKNNLVTNRPISSVRPTLIPAFDDVREESRVLLEKVTERVIKSVQPTTVSEKRRQELIEYMQNLIKRCVSCEVLPFGSVPLKTYLPDGDIDLTVIGPSISDEISANAVRQALLSEEKNNDAVFEVRDVQYVNAEVKLVKCVVQNVVVDISFSQTGGISTLCFLEHVDRQIGKDHLLKRSILLIKSWCYYESRILGAHHGLISTYGLETLVLYIFHMFHSSLNCPSAVLYKFLDYYGKFDWDKYCVSLYGPVLLSSLPALVGDDSENNGGHKLFTEEFLRSCVEKFSVTLFVPDSPTKFLPKKHLNIVDPLKDNNNLGRSVGKGNFLRIRSAFAYGAKKLANLLCLPTEQIEAEVNSYFKCTLERNRSGERPDVYNLNTVADNNRGKYPHEKLCKDFTSINVSNPVKVNKWFEKKTESSSRSDASILRNGTSFEKDKESEISKFSLLADLSGEFDLLMNNLMRVQFMQDFAMGNFYPVSPRAPVYQYHNTNSDNSSNSNSNSNSNGYQNGWYGAYSQMSNNGLVPLFPPMLGYPLSPPPFIHSGYAREDFPRPRGTGTYFPVTNYEAYRERTQVRRGRNSAYFNNVPRNRYNYQVEDTSPQEEKGFEGPPPPPLQLPVVTRRSVRQSATYTPRSLIKEAPQSSASVHRGETELKFGSLTPVPAVAPPSAHPSLRRGRSFDSVNPRNNGSAPAPPLPPPPPAPRAYATLQNANSNLERLTQIFQLKDEDDFPPLNS